MKCGSAVEKVYCEGGGEDDDEGDEDGVNAEDVRDDGGG